MSFVWQLVLFFFFFPDCLNELVSSACLQYVMIHSTNPMGKRLVDFQPDAILNSATVRIFVWFVYMSKCFFYKERNRIAGS